MGRTNTEYTEIKFRCQAKKTTPQGSLIEFIKNDEILSSKEMILQALKAYWMPLAMSKVKYISEQELEFAGARAIQELKRQIQEIAMVVGLELEEIYERATPSFELDRMAAELIADRHTLPSRHEKKDVEMSDEDPPYTDFGL